MWGIRVCVLLKRDGKETSTAILLPRCFFYICCLKLAINGAMVRHYHVQKRHLYCSTYGELLTQFILRLNHLVTRFMYFTMGARLLLWALIQCAVLKLHFDRLRAVKKRMLIAFFTPPHLVLNS